MRILDLFCGAGGAAMGYHMAGFEVVGIDIEPQPRYPFEFIRADAFMFMRNLGDSTEIMKGNGWGYADGEGASGSYGYTLDGFDAIHASPPCQAYSVANNIHGRNDHPDLIGETRDWLYYKGLPYVMENVPGSPLQDAALVCGQSLGLNVKRHRLFESSLPLLSTVCPKGHPGDYLIIFGGVIEERGHQIGRTAKNGPMMRRRRLPLWHGQHAMGINWMNEEELSQAVPPAYTEFIGKQILANIANARLKGVST